MTLCVTHISKVPGPCHCKMMLPLTICHWVMLIFPHNYSQNFPFPTPQQEAPFPPHEVQVTVNPHRTKQKLSYTEQSGLNPMENQFTKAKTPHQFHIPVAGMLQFLPKICGDCFHLHIPTGDRQGHRRKMLWHISPWQVLTEDFCALQGGEGKKQREKLCRYFCKDKYLEKLNTQGSQSGKGKAWGHMRLLESSWPQSKRVYIKIYL